MPITDDLKKAIRELTDDERLELFSDYCLECGRYDVNEDNSIYYKGCQCWNDD